MHEWILIFPSAKIVPCHVAHYKSDQPNHFVSCPKPPHSCTLLSIWTKLLQQHLETPNEGPNESGELAHAQPNWKPKSTKLPKMDTSQMSFNRCRDHICLTKSTMFAEQSGGMRIVEQTSPTLSQQVCFFTHFWAHTKLEFSTLKRHPNHSPGFPINRAHLSLQEPSLTTIKNLLKTHFTSFKNRAFGWNLGAIFNITKAFQHLPWTFLKLTESIEAAETPSPELLKSIGTTTRTLFWQGS